MTQNEICQYFKILYTYHYQLHHIIFFYENYLYGSQVNNEVYSKDPPVPVIYCNTIKHYLNRKIKLIVGMVEKSKPVNKVAQMYTHWKVNFNYYLLHKNSIQKYIDR